MRRGRSVLSATLSRRDPHILLVSYNPKGVSSAALLSRLRERGVPAALFGL